MKNAEKHRETLEMAKKPAAGMTYRQIDAAYGMVPAAVGQRLRRMGRTPDEKTARTLLRDKDRLVLLYEIERLSLDRIAAAFGFSDGVIRRALKLYRIPKRPPLSPGGKHVDRMRHLLIGETGQIECSAQSPFTVITNTARALGIKVSIRRTGTDRFGITRIDPAAAAAAEAAEAALKEARKISELTRIDKKSLEEMFHGQGLSIDKIAENLGCGSSLIGKALQFYEIAKRPRLWGSGKYTSVYKRLAVSETVELECSTKYPNTNLHTIASRVGIKISMKKIGDGRFRVTRLR